MILQNYSKKRWEERKNTHDAETSRVSFVLLYKPNYLDSLIAACAATKQAMSTQENRIKPVF